MFIGGRLRGKFTIAIAGLLTLLYLINFKEINYDNRYLGRIFGAISSQNTHNINYEYSSKCECRRNEKISILNQQNFSKKSYQVRSTQNNLKYTVKGQEIDELVCGVYETLRRGRHQKVIGYSLYGKLNQYTRPLKSRKYKI